MELKKQKPVRVVSEVLADGTLIESVQPEARAPTSVVVARGNDLEIESTWKHDGVEYVPIPAGHNLIKHRAVRLPGHPVEYASVELLAKERPAFSKATLRYANAHKTLAMQMALMENPRKAKEATAILLLGGSKGAAIHLKAHEALRELAQHPGSSNAYELIDTCARKLLGKLGLRAEANGEAPSWARLHGAGGDWQQVISGIRSLNGIELDALIALLVILCFGTERMEGQEPQEPANGQASSYRSSNGREQQAARARFGGGPTVRHRFGQPGKAPRSS